MPTKNVHTCETNVGEITYIDSRRTNRPAGLRRPYEYVKKRSTFLKKFANIEKSMNNLKEGTKFQCVGIFKKPVTYGVKIDFFLLGYDVGATGDNTGVTEAEWVEATNALKKNLKSLLGKDAEPYIEPYSTSGRGKFQARFSTYVMLKE